MVTSPSSSPPPKWSSNLRGGVGSGSGQLLQELEALSHALYQSQKKAPPPPSYPSQLSPQLQPQPPPVKKHSFLSRKEATQSGRRLSHDPGADQSSSAEPVPFSSLSPHDPPTSFTSLLSRHSLSSAHAPPSSVEQQKAAANNYRFSASVAPSHKPSAWGEEKSDIRARTDRRLSLQPSQSKSLEKSNSQELQDWPEDSLESSRRFDSSSSEKKKSVWSSWKPFRALSHLGRQRLHCVFSAYVHAIEGLPPAMNGLRLCVHMRKEETKEGAVQTMPSRVFQGIAEFQETLFMKCTLYGNKGPSNTMKFMEKAFIVSVIAPDIDELDFGRHQLDLSRLLGDFLEERKGQLEKGNSWDTMLDLTGKAKGGRLSITFNYEILDKDSSFSGNVSSRFRESPPHRSSIHNSFSLPNSAHGTPRTITTRAHLSHSPSVSEPGNDYDDLLAMDQLNLDEPPPAPKAPPVSEAQETRGGQKAEVQGFPAFRSQADRPPIPSQGTFNAFPSVVPKIKTFSQTDEMSSASLPLQSSERVFEGTAGVIKEEDNLPSEDEDDFVVVDQGMEIDQSMEKHTGSIVVGEELDGAEEEGSEDLIPHVVKMDTMDDLPQVVDIEALDDLSPQVVDMEAFDDLPPRVVQMEAHDDPMPSVDEIETLDVCSLQEAPSQVPEKEESHDLQGCTKDVKKPSTEELEGERQQLAAVHAVESSGDDKEVHEDVEKIVTVDEGGRKDSVTYMMVMQTLDSLLQGTSAKELLQEEEKVEVESSADGIFSDEEDKEMINVTSQPTVKKDPKISVMELSADVYDTAKNVEDDGYDSEDLREKESSSKDIKEVLIMDAEEEEEEEGKEEGSEGRGGPHAFEEEERHCDSEEGAEEEGAVSVWQAEDRNFSPLDDGTHNNKLSEEEKRGSCVEEVDSSSIVEAKEEERCFDVVRESEKGLGGLKEEGSDHGIGDIVPNSSDANVLNEAVEEARVSMSSNAEATLKESTDEKLDDAVLDDIDSEVDLVAGEFLDMLGMGNSSVNNGYDSEVDSPRARLLKQFEEEALLEGGFGLDFDAPEFSLDGAAMEEDTWCLPTAPLQGLASKGVEQEPTNWDFASTVKQKDKESANRDYALASSQIEEEADGIVVEPVRWDSVTALKEMGEEPSDQHHPLASKGLGKEPALQDQTLDFKEIDPDTASTDLSVAMGREPAHSDHTSAVKVKDADLPSWTQTLAMKGMENESNDLGMEKKPNDREPLFPLEQMDKEPSYWDQASAVKTKDEGPASWYQTLAMKETDKEPLKSDHSLSVDKTATDRDLQISSEHVNKEPTHWDHDLASKELEKEPKSRASALLPNTVDSEPANWNLDEDEELMSFMEAAESELQRATQSMRSKSRAKMLEDEETEALMQEWGLNEKAFVSPQPKPTIRQQEPPPLGRGLGGSVSLKDGGSLRSMNPSLFQANKSSGKLVMQISKPLVVPAEMGTETADILRNMASMGIENMAVQAMTAMPLEDITGRSVEQVAIEGMTAGSKSGHRLLEGSTGSRKDLMSRLDRKSRTSSQNIVDDFVSLEDIAPMAMQQIEALAIDGLKIQADVIDDDVPFALNSFSVDGESGGKDMASGSAILKGVTGVHLSKGSTSSSVETPGDGSGKGLMGMAISLNEWMLLDAGLYDEAETKKDALALMAAHHAAHQEMVVAGDDEKRKRRQGSKNAGGRWGCMGNTLTIAMLVQLRDPLKNNEAVGAPMMAFVQAERMMKPPKMKVGRNVSMKGNTEDEEEAAEEPQFKITGVHMSGLKASQEEKKIGWGNQKQLQSGSRWLIANGMTKNAKINSRPMLGSKPAAPAPASSSKTNASKGESLWSISSRALSSGLRWRDKLKFNAKQ